MSYRGPNGLRKHGVGVDGVELSMELRGDAVSKVFDEAHVHGRWFSASSWHRNRMSQPMYSAFVVLLSSTTTTPHSLYLSAIPATSPETPAELSLSRRAHTMASYAPDGRLLSPGEYVLHRWLLAPGTYTNPL
jgi:hypothetical protein